MNYLSIILIILFFSTGLMADIPSFDSVRESYLSSEAHFYDRTGKLLHTLRVDDSSRILDWVLLEDISPFLIKALIIAEDKRFYKHNGVDYLALGSGLWSRATGGKIRGASTISMQTAALLNPDIKPLKGRRTVLQKLKQIKIAYQLENKWSKYGILEAYLNLVTYRGELVGIKAASLGLFNKEPISLSKTESLLLVSMVKSPNSTPLRLAKRACYLSNILKEPLECETIKNFAELNLSKMYSIKRNIGIIPHFSRKILSLEKNQEIRTFETTIDKQLQLLSIDILNQHLYTLKDQNVQDAGILIVSNLNGEVLAYVGSSGEFSQSPAVDAVSSKRQAGSTLKPFVYAIALEENLITPDTLLEDTPTEFSVSTGIYKPSNYQNSFHGNVKAKMALASSLNIPAIKVLSMIGVRKFIDRLNQMNVTDLKDSGYYGLSGVLGTVDITLLELVNAYRTLSNNGLYSELKFMKGAENSKEIRIFQEKASKTITEILSDRENRMLTFGLENPLSTRYNSAVKTGTSKDMRDNWCIGYSKQYTVGVWVGNFSGKPMWNVSGTSGAASIWIDVMNRLPNSFNLNNQNESIPIKTEYSLAKKYTDANSILAPVNQTIIAIDPDIPDDNQFVFFEAKIPSEKNIWILNKKKISDSSEPYFWKPVTGNYQLELVNSENNKVLDSVLFEVR